MTLQSRLRPVDATIEVASHRAHPTEWVVDAETHRVVKRPCRQCEQARLQATGGERAGRSA